MSHLLMALCNNSFSAGAREFYILVVEVPSGEEVQGGFLGCYNPAPLVFGAR